MHVRVPQAGYEGLAGAVDDLRAHRRLDLGGGAELGDQAAVDHHRFVRHEPLALDERAHVREGHRSGGRRQQFLQHGRRAGGQGLVLRLLQDR
jgi:hypothetical protein